jgi:hypothetical protein
MIAAWFRERFTLRLFLPLAIFVGFVASGGLKSLVVDVGFALLLLTQFRLWDDLADRTVDAVTHPHRVLVRAPEVTGAIAFCGALAVLNICLAVWRDGSGLAVAMLALLDGALSVWYLARPVVSAGSKDPAYARVVLPLVKYPTILAIVAAGRLATAPVLILTAAAVLFAVVCAYETWHDPSGPLARRVSTGGH